MKSDRKCAAEQGSAEEEALKKGMEETSREFVERSAEFGTRAALRVCNGSPAPHAGSMAFVR